MTATAPTHNDQHMPPPPAHRRRAVTLVILGVLLVVVVVAGAVVHLASQAAYQRSFDPSTTLDRRTLAAVYAARLEPWNPVLRTHAVVMQKWDEGVHLLADHQVLEAMLVLGEAYRLDVGNGELLSDFQQAQAQLNLNSNFKAHVQHGHEGPGGSLQPQDILR